MSTLTSDAGLGFGSDGLASTRSSWAHLQSPVEAERAILVKGEAVKLVNLRRVQARKTAESVVPSLEAADEPHAAQSARVHSITSEIHVHNDNENDSDDHYSLATKPRQVEGDLRLPWIWVEGWRARLRMSGDVVEKSRWEWKMDDAPGIRRRAGTVVSQIPSVVSMSGTTTTIPTRTGIGMRYPAHMSDPGPGAPSETRAQTQRSRAVTVPGVFGRLGGQVVDRGYAKEENRPRRKSVRWASILG